MFSNPSGQQSFGSNTSQNLGMFGSTPAPNAAASAPTSSGFGAPAGGMFGSTPAPASTGFGTAPTSTGLFGASSSTPGMFGSTPASSGGGLFGSTPAASSGLFGAAPAGSTGMFGSTPAPSSGLFGAAPTGSTGMFGSTPAPSGSGLFGATPAASTGLFGTAPKASTGMFGSTPASSAGGLFGSTPAASTGMFGKQGGTSSIFGAQPAAGNSWSANNFNGQSFNGQQPLMPHQLSIEDHINNMVAAWNPASPSCQFKHYFYNMVHSSQVELYKPTAPHELMAYERAQQNNPDPSCMVPVLAIGFSDLKKRIDSQDQQTKAHLLKLSEMHSEAESIERKHQLETTPKLREYKRRQAAIAHKLLQLMKYIQILRNKGYSIRAEEEALRSRLEALEKEFTRSSVFKGKFLEIYTQVRSLGDSMQYSAKSDTYSLVNESSLNAISETLKNQNLGLSHLTSILQSDKKDLEVMIRAYSETLIKKS